MNGRVSAAPVRVDLRAYNVGFGDSFLLTFTYPSPLADGRDVRHMLIDCGTTRANPKGPTMSAVAALIAEHCDHQLDVLVVTHRHKDHLSAFGDRAAAATLDELRPKLVVRPWTDDPNAPIDATGPSRRLDDASRRFVTSLRAGQEAAALIGNALRTKAADTRSLSGELKVLALDQVPNLAAVERLDSYAAESRAVYVSYGDDTRIDRHIPGVDVDVLGPPTVAAWPEVTRQRESDTDEFWMLARRLVDTGLDAAGIDPGRPDRWDAFRQSGRLGPARWLLEHLDEQRTASLLRIVRSFDESINNTSLILLIEACDRRMLFSGDAQIENWSYALTNPRRADENRERLSRIDLYKVGHHGSRNATPRSLFNFWTAPGANDHPMVSVLSTLPGVHGKRAATAVPRATLVNALRGRTELYATDELGEGATHLHLAATERPGRFELVG